jgi:hypothetical protein
MRKIKKILYKVAVIKKVRFLSAVVACQLEQEQ